MRYRRLEKNVDAEPMNAFDFLRLLPNAKIDGGRKSDHRNGYKMVDGEAVSWMEREEFLKEFVEVSG